MTGIRLHNQRKGTSPSVLPELLADDDHALRKLP